MQECGIRWPTKSFRRLDPRCPNSPSLDNNKKNNMTTEDENSEEYMQAIKDCFALFGKGFSVCVYCVSQRCMLNWSKSNSLTHKTMDARFH